jgi:acyl dehydratase
VAIDQEKLLHWPFEEITQSFTPKDVILYALGIGAGADPLDEDDLRLVFEERLEVLPTYATILGYPGLWLRDPGTGVDWQRMVHAEQSVEIHRPLPVSGSVTARTKVDGIIDKGKDRGALIYTSRDVRDAATGEVLASVRATSFARADGGFGGPAGPQPTPHAIPDRDPDLVETVATLPQAALIYRLSGDFNPLHIDPAVAARAGFDRPILHGLCTYGATARVLTRAVSEGRPSRIRRIDARFTAPVFPGETLRVAIWRESSTTAAFTTSVIERDVVALGNGYIEHD